ncbi:DUF4429 domain-containing protein [bacterium]|nr:DUF4429 domain-containing protein [bacterium]
MATNQQATSPFAQSIEPTKQISSDQFPRFIKGVNGEIEYDQNSITISRKRFLGFLTNGLDGNKIIYINQLSAIQFRKPGTLTNGYIQFVFQGSQESKAGILNATHDENTVMFSQTQLPDFEELRAFVDGKLRQKFSSDTAPSKPSEADELVKFASLRDQGIITEAEFQAKKKQLLGL